jgi:hypothetical protein
MLIRADGGSDSIAEPAAKTALLKDESSTRSNQNKIQAQPTSERQTLNDVARPFGDQLGQTENNSMWARNRDAMFASIRAGTDAAVSESSNDPIQIAAANTDRAAAASAAAAVSGKLAAQKNLKVAVETEIRTRMDAPGQPPLTAQTLYAAAAQTVEERFVGKAGAAEVKNAVIQLGAEEAEKNAADKLELEINLQLKKAVETSKSDPAKALTDINTLMSTLTPENQEAVLANSMTEQVAMTVSAYANEPLVEYTKALADKKVSANDLGPMEYRLNESTQRIIDTTAKLDPRLVSIVLDKETINISQMFKKIGVDKKESFLLDPVTAQNLTILAGRTVGTANSQAVIDRVIELTGAQNWNALGSMNAIGNLGASPALVIRLGELRGDGNALNQLAAGQIEKFAKEQIDKDYNDYLRANAQLGWLVASEGPAMTPEQLKLAVNDYIAEHPDHQKKVDAAQAKLALDGEKLIKQLNDLRALTKGDFSTDKTVLKAIESALTPDASKMAIEAAVNANPALITGKAGVTLIESLSSVSDFWNKRGMEPFRESIVLQYVNSSIVKTLEKLDPKGPLSRQIAFKELKALAQDPFVRSLENKNPTQLYDQIVIMEQKIKPGRDAKRVRQDLNKYKAELLNDPAFKTADSPAQLNAKGLFLERIGTMFAVAGFVSASSNLKNDPNLLNGIDTIINAGEVYNALVPKGGKFGEKIAQAVGFESFGKVLGAAGAAVDGVRAVTAFSDKRYADSAFSGAAAAGTLLATFGGAAWTGPVGVALIGVGVFGKMQYDKVKESNKNMNETTARFLGFAGFDPDAARALSDQTKNGVSAVPLIMEIGKAKKMSTEQTVAEINQMSENQLKNYRDDLHFVLDYFGDDKTLKQLAQMIVKNEQPVKDTATS